MMSKRLFAVVLCFVLLISILPTFAAEPDAPEPPIESSCASSSSEALEEPPAAPTSEPPPASSQPEEQPPALPGPTPELPKEESREYTPEEMGLLLWDDPLRSGAGILGRGLMMAPMAATSTLGDLPSGTVVNIQYSSSGSTWALPIVVVTKDVQQYGRGTIVRTLNTQGLMALFNGGYLAGRDFEVDYATAEWYLNSTGAIWMNNTFYNNVDPRIKAQIQPFPVRYEYYVRDTVAAGKAQVNTTQNVWIPSSTEIMAEDKAVSGVDGYPFLGRTEESISKGLTVSGGGSFWGTTRSEYFLRDTMSSRWQEHKYYDVYSSGTKTRVLSGDFRSANRNNKLFNIVPFFMLSNDIRVTPKGDGSYDVVFNSPPNAPASINYANAIAGESIEVTCAAATDPDGDAVTYLWESSINGGAFSQFASTTTPKTSITIPASGANIRLRVRTKDPSNEYSGYTTGAAIPIIFGPSVAGVPNYGSPQAGQAIAISVTAATHPSGLPLWYSWERSTDGGNMWTPIGESSVPTITDYAPTSGLNYRIRVRTRDSNNKYSEWSAGDNKTLNYAPTMPVYTEHSIRYTDSKIHISWEPSTDVNGDALIYTVESKIFGAPDYATVYTGEATSCDVPIPSTGTTYLYRIMATDGRGGSSGYLNGTATGFDRTPPTGSITASITDWTKDDVALTLTASDTGGAGMRRVRLQSGEWVSGNTITHTTTENGVYVFEMEDWTGNLSTAGIDVINIDKGLPVVEGIGFSPTDDTILNRLYQWLFEKQALIQITTNSPVSGVKSIEYQLVEQGGQLEDAKWQPYTAGQSKIAVEFSGYVAARMTNGAGTVSEVLLSDSVVVDDTPPTGTHILSTTQWTNQDLTITVTGYDPGSGMANITLPNGAVVSGDTASYTVPENGSYEFILTNFAGKATTYVVKPSNIDKQPPLLPQLPIEDTWARGNRPIEVNIEQVVAPSGIEKVQYNISPLRVDIGPEPDAEPAYQPLRMFAFNAPFLPSFNDEWHDYTGAPIVIEEEGEFLVKLRAVSKAGSVSPVDEYTVRNDLTPPQIAHTLAGNVIHLTATDELSGVARIILPDGGVIDGDEATYRVKTSGDYTFKAVDRAGEGNAADYTIPVSISSGGGSDRDEVTPDNKNSAPAPKPTVYPKYIPNVSPKPDKEVETLPDNDMFPRTDDLIPPPETSQPLGFSYSRTDWFLGMMVAQSLLIMLLLVVLIHAIIRKQNSSTVVLLPAGFPVMGTHSENAKPTPEQELEFYKGFKELWDKLFSNPLRVEAPREAAVNLNSASPMSLDRREPHSGLKKFFSSNTARSPKHEDLSRHFGEEVRIQEEKKKDTPLKAGRNPFAHAWVKNWEDPRLKPVAESEGGDDVIPPSALAGDTQDVFEDEDTSVYDVPDKVHLTASERLNSVSVEAGVEPFRWATEESEQPLTHSDSFNRMFGIE